jgi:adenosylmethionine-8-amino-7-oxononanoate aminotransferase
MADMDASRYAFLPGPGDGLQIARAEGCFLETPAGHRILDAAGGAIVANIGHGRREVAEAAAEAMVRNTYVVPPFATQERVALVERLQDRWLPEGIRRCAFASGGSESVDLAIRIARQHFVSKGEPARHKVIGRAASYHGTTLSGLDLGGHTKRKQAFEPYFQDTPRAPACYPLRCELCRGEARCNLLCADGIEAAILAAGAESVAAVFVEPIAGSTLGAVVPPEEYLPRVADLCRHHGVLLVADEVMTGFGRTGAKFAVDHWGVIPDLLVGGKGLAGGYASIGGVYAKESVTDPIAAAGDDVMFYTFAAHPAACAAADKVLEILEREALVERAAKLGPQLRERLLDALGEHPHVAEVRGRGLLQAVELVRDRESLEPFAPEDNLTATVVAAGIAHGAFFYPGGVGIGDVLCLGPPLVISEGELDLLVSILVRSLDSALERVAARS